MLGRVMISMTCGCPGLPTFVERLGLDIFSLALLAALCGSFEDAGGRPPLLCQIPRTRGPLACYGKAVVRSVLLIV